MKSDTNRLVTTAMLIAIGTVISVICEIIPFLNLPFGGTVTICSMLPIVFVSYMYGIKWGLLSGFVYGVLQMLIGFRTVSALFLPESDTYMGIFVAFSVIFLDYILAFSSLGLGGIFRNKMKKRNALLCGTACSLIICYLFHTLSGAVFYGEWAEWFFTETVFKDFAFSKKIMTNISGTALAFIYSFIYNGCYMIPEIIISTLSAIPISRIIPEIKK